MTRLVELIKDIPDDDWLDISEQGANKYISYIGRVPKKLVIGEVLDYEVLRVNNIQYRTDYTLHSFLVKSNPE